MASEKAARKKENTATVARSASSRKSTPDAPKRTKQSATLEEQIEIVQQQLANLAAMDGVAVVVQEVASNNKTNLPLLVRITMLGVRYCGVCQNLRADTGTPCQYCVGDTGTQAVAA